MSLPEDILKSGSKRAKPSTTKKQLNVRIPLDLFQALRRAAVDTDSSAQDIVTAVLSDYLDSSDGQDVASHLNELLADFEA